MFPCILECEERDWGGLEGELISEGLCITFE